MYNFDFEMLLLTNGIFLKVDKKERYGWEPKKLLQLLTDLYLHLMCDEFIEFLAKEERSYTPDLFTTAIATMSKIPQNFTQDTLNQWTNLSQKV